MFLLKSDRQREVGIFGAFVANPGLLKNKFPERISDWRRLIDNDFAK